MRPDPHPLEAPAGYLGSTARLLSRTKKRIAEETAFDRAVGRHLRAVYRAMPPETEYGHFVIETRFGRLVATPRGTWIHLRFDDPDRATKALPNEARWIGELNPYSGKWNIHLSEPDLVANLRELDRRLEMVT